MSNDRRKAKGFLGELLSEPPTATYYKTRNRMLVAAKIATALRQQGMTQRQLADMTGKSTSEVSEWLSGDRNMTIDTLTDISRALGITLLDTETTDITLKYGTLISIKMPKAKVEKYTSGTWRQCVPSTGYERIGGMSFEKAV